MAVHRGNGRARKARSALLDEEPDKVVLYHDWCKRCGICVAFCPRKALTTDEAGYPQLSASSQCNSCGLCEVLCPDFAVTVPARRRPARSRAKTKKQT
ncbi:MAG: 4Fe-4S binding protein [Chloroflexota bacterium]|nr:4Fe-4S binding protein [Chloroflexota bacterium]